MSILGEYLKDRWLGRDVVIGEDKQMTALLQREGWKCIMQDSAVCYTAALDDLKLFEAAVKMGSIWLHVLLQAYLVLQAASSIDIPHLAPLPEPSGVPDHSVLRCLPHASNLSS